MTANTGFSSVKTPARSWANRICIGKDIRKNRRSVHADPVVGVFANNEINAW
ncbi:MAG: hypothetical protein INR69_17030 [Mucilaginibacter polytrichastri]|nr:hypothetical protein [Mucilaginibacter polytrichastri]